MTGFLRSIPGITISWAVVWLATWSLVGLAIGFFDPDSIDPGDQWLLFVIFGPMGLLTGAAFAFLLRRTERRRQGVHARAIAVAAWGTLATALVQTLYLGHGDQGLVANIQMAIAFSGLGGLGTLVWRLVAWPRP